MIENIIDSFTEHSDRNAFFIDGEYFSYAQVFQKVSQIRESLAPYLPTLQTKHIAVFIFNDLESYCSCLAVLLSGFAYVPLNPLIPSERNLEILRQSSAKIVLSSQPEDLKHYRLEASITVVNTKKLESSTNKLDFPLCKDDDPAYIIFTSGSTGKPKGTIITRGNLNTFLDSVTDLGWEISESDRFLQMSSMTFDMSIITFIIPLCIGACIYVVPEEEIKYLYGYKLMQELDITFIAVVPSSISYLKPYFNEIHLPALRYSLVCGEAFPIDLADEWSQCVPNARIINIYGPTEATVFTHTYDFQKGLREESYNNIMALGNIVKNMDAIILDENGGIVEIGSKGELCIAGKQLSGGYINNPRKNSESFFFREEEGKEKRYYRTGDIVFQDPGGCYFYVGRADSQVKIQGHRVELGDIEKHARDCVRPKFAVASSQTNRFGNNQIHLVVEKSEQDVTDVYNYLKKKVPYYMIPSTITVIQRMPLNANGKIDRKAVRYLLEQKESENQDTDSDTNQYET